MAVPDLQFFFSSMLGIANDGEEHSIKDGRGLAGYMIDFNIGASVNATYYVKRIDTDYFVEE